MLYTYSSEPLTVLGQLSVQVCYNGYVGTHPLVVVKGNGSNLMGRDWLSVIRLDWASIKAVTFGRPTLDNLVKRYSEVFAPGVGTMQKVRAHLSLKEGAQPRFCRPRTVPYALKDRVGKELDRLEETGVIRKVNGHLPLCLYLKRMAP